MILKLVIGIALCLLREPLTATLVPRFSLEELTKRADKIIQGKVIRSWPAWDAEHRFIWTHYELAVIDHWKGTCPSKLLESELGGTLDGRKMEIEGTPRFRAGEQLILFLYKTPIGYWRTQGYGQGRYNIQDGRIRVGFSGMELIQTRGQVPGTALESLDGLTVAEFKKRVSTIVTKQNSRDTR